MDLTQPDRGDRKVLAQSRPVGGHRVRIVPDVASKVAKRPSRDEGTDIGRRRPVWNQELSHGEGFRVAP